MNWVGSICAIRRSVPLLCTLLGALCLLLPMRAAEALSLAYAHHFGNGYVDALQRASSEPLQVQGKTAHLLEFFQDRRVDAIEAYDFQAQYFLRGASEHLYWYPHFTAVIVLAVAQDCPVAIEDWVDLREDVSVALPDASPEREIFFHALTRGFSTGADRSEGFAQLARMKQEGRLRFYSTQRASSYRMVQADGGADVYVLFLHEAEFLRRCGAPLRICVPKEGTLSFTKGLLSRHSIAFDDSIYRDLRKAGYPIERMSAAVPVTDTDAFFRALAQAHTFFQQEQDLFDRVPRAPHERFTILVLTLVVTVLWGGSLRQRMLHHGARRAVMLLIVMLLLWEMDRLAKILTVWGDTVLEHLQWYLYYVFRAGLSVALLWIAWASDEDVHDRKMPRWLRTVFGCNLFLAALILCNDLHHQFFTFTWNAATMSWSEHLAWGAYAYWMLWFSEIFAALLFLLEKAKRQRVLCPSMALPFLLFALFIFYSTELHYDPRFEWLELTTMTALFFLLLTELCLRTGLMPSNRYHRVFFSHARLNMQLVDMVGNTVFASTVPEQGAAADLRVSRMGIHGGAIVWYEDLSLLHERQYQLGLLRDALKRSHTLLRKEHRIRKEHLSLTLKKQLSEELESILGSKRPLLRHYREQLMTVTAPEEVTRILRRLNLLSSYLKKRCVLFLKGQENGQIRADELSMAVSEFCSYVRPLGLRIGVDWELERPLRAAEALKLFDFFAEFLARAAREDDSDVFCRFFRDEEPAAVFMLTYGAWMDPWIAQWKRLHRARIETSDLGYAFSITMRGMECHNEADAEQAPVRGEEVHAWKV